MTSAPRLRGEGLQRLTERLSQRDWAVLQDVDRFRLMTGRQLQRLYIGEGESAARATRRLVARLSTDQFLVRLPRVVGGVRAGSSGHVLALGPAGVQLLHPDQPRRRHRDVRDGFLKHTLAIADLYVTLRLAERRGDLELLRLTTSNSQDLWMKIV